eukprot:1072619-Rhodomonas_salina.2
MLRAWLSGFKSDHSQPWLASYHRGVHAEQITGDDVASCRNKSWCVLSSLHERIRYVSIPCSDASVIRRRVQLGRVDGQRIHRPDMSLNRPFQLQDTGFTSALHVRISPACAHRAVTATFMPATHELYLPCVHVPDSDQLVVESAENFLPNHSQLVHACNITTHQSPTSSA